MLDTDFCTTAAPVESTNPEPSAARVSIEKSSDFISIFWRVIILSIDDVIFVTIVV